MGSARSRSSAMTRRRLPSLSRIPAIVPQTPLWWRHSKVMTDNLQVSVNGQQVRVKTTAGDALRQARSAAANNPLDVATPQEAAAWIDSNVSNIAGVVTALKHIVRLLFVLRAEIRHRK